MPPEEFCGLRSYEVTRLSSTQSPAVPPRVATPVTQQQPRKARRWLAVAALLTLPTLGVGLFTATVGSTQLREAQAAGDRFIDVVTDHRYADAYDLTSSEFRRTTSSTRFSEMCDQYLTQAGAMGRFESAGGGFGAYTGGFSGAKPLSHPLPTP